jgi:putative transposase
VLVICGSGSLSALESFDAHREALYVDIDHSLKRNGVLWVLNHLINRNGKPKRKGHIERFNGTFREDMLDRYAFDSLEQARTYAYAWMWRYNNERPHSSLGWKSPIDFMQERL